MANSSAICDSVSWVAISPPWHPPYLALGLSPCSMAPVPCFPVDPSGTGTLRDMMVQFTLLAELSIGGICVPPAPEAAAAQCGMCESHLLGAGQSRSSEKSLLLTTCLCARGFCLSLACDVLHKARMAGGATEWWGVTFLRAALLHGPMAPTAECIQAPFPSLQ